MPKIPTYTAGGETAIVNYPNVPNLPNYGAGEALGQAITNLGNTTADIADRLDHQQGDLEAVKMTTSYNTGIARIQNTVLTDQTIENPVEEYTKRAGELQEQLRSTTKRGYVQDFFDKHVDRKNSTAVIEVESAGLKLQAQRMLGELDKLVSENVTVASENLDPVLRDLKIVESIAAIDRATGRRLLDPKQAADMKLAVRKTMLEKNMMYVGMKDPALLFKNELEGKYAEVDGLRRLKVLEDTRKEMDRKEVKAESSFRLAQRIVKEDYDALANFGKLPEATITKGLAGQDPILSDPVVWRELKRVNDNPPTSESGGNVRVQAIMEEYYAKYNTTPGHIQKTRDALNHLRSNTTSPDPDISLALKELASNERSVLGIQNTNMNNAIKQGVDGLKEDPAMTLPGFIGQMMKAKSAADQAKIRNLIRGGMKPEDAVKKIEAEHQKIIEQTPTSRKTIQELLK